MTTLVKELKLWHFVFREEEIKIHAEMVKCWELKWTRSPSTRVLESPNEYLTHKPLWRSHNAVVSCHLTSFVYLLRGKTT